MQIVVRSINNESLNVIVDASTTVLDIKQQLEKRTHIAVEKQRLIFIGKELSNDVTVADCGLIHGTCIFLLFNEEGITPEYNQFCDEIGEDDLEAKTEDMDLETQQNVMCDDPLYCQCKLYIKVHQHENWNDIRKTILEIQETNTKLVHESNIEIDVVVAQAEALRQQGEHLRRQSKIVFSDDRPDEAMQMLAQSKKKVQDAEAQELEAERLRNILQMSLTNAKEQKDEIDLAVMLHTKLTDKIDVLLAQEQEEEQEEANVKTVNSILQSYQDCHLKFEKLCVWQWHKEQQEKDARLAKIQLLTGQIQNSRQCITENEEKIRHLEHVIDLKNVELAEQKRKMSIQEAKVNLSHAAQVEVLKLKLQDNDQIMQNKDANIKEKLQNIEQLTQVVAEKDDKQRDLLQKWKEEKAIDAAEIQSLRDQILKIQQCVSEKNKTTRHLEDVSASQSKQIDTLNTCATSASTAEAAGAILKNKMKLLKKQLEASNESNESKEAKVQELLLVIESKNMVIANQLLELKTLKQGERQNKIACTMTLSGHKLKVTDLSCNPDGIRLASASFDHLVKVWNIMTGACLMDLPHNSKIHSVRWHSDGIRLVSGSEDHRIVIWNVLQGTHSLMLPGLAISLVGHMGCVHSVCWHPGVHSDRLASGSADKLINIWNTAKRKKVTTLKGHTNCVTCVQWNSDGTRLASASYDKSIKIWDPDRNICIATLQGHNDVVFHLSWKCNGRGNYNNNRGALLLSASHDARIKIWDLRKSGKCGKSIFLCGEITGSITGGHVHCADWHPNGTHIAFGSVRDGVVKICDVNQLSCLPKNTEDAHCGHITALSFFKDGLFLASASVDRKIKIWKTYLPTTN